MTRILAPYLIGAVLAAAIAGGVFFAGVQWANREHLKDYIDGTEDATDATTDLPATDDGILEWLRDFAN
jgi:hypothetical protein